MKSLTQRLVLGCLSLLLAATATSEVPSLILTGGVIHTMDESRSKVAAIAITGDTISAIGDAEPVLALKGDTTAVVDLQGRSVFPGFTDAHVHPGKGGDTLLSLSFTDQDGAVGIQTKLKRYATKYSHRRVITGSGWSLTQFERGNPHKSILDAVAPDRPVILTDSNHHSLWLNSAALREAGIIQETADPLNGTIERDSTGEPSGVLRESAMRLADKLIPNKPLEARRARLEAGLAHLNGYGYTSLLVAAAETTDDVAWLSIANKRVSSVHIALLPDSLPLQSKKSISHIPYVLDELKGRRAMLQGEFMTASTVKVFLDGGLESCTAAFLKSYASAGCGNGHVGSLNYPPDFLNAYVKALQAEGFAIHVHAIGDRATRTALDAIEGAGSSGRHGISHLQFVHPDELDRFAQTGTAAVIQALWAFPYDNSMLPFHGTKIGPWRYPFSALAGAGALLVAGSDWPVSTANPFHALEVAVLRRDQGDRKAATLLREQAITVDQYMAALTVNGARYFQETDVRGTLEAGKRADLVILSADPYKTAAHRLSDIAVLATMVRGRVVHGGLSQ